VKIHIFVFLFLLSSCATNSSRDILVEKSKLPLKEQLRKFTSDGCSMWPDGTRSKPNAWLKCCYKHDRVYWLGGTYQQRENADRELRNCVKKSFSNFMGILMYMGVRVGGKPRYDTSYKWGYGWTYERGYVHLTKEEFDFAQNLSPFDESDYANIE
jgi:hypothetical protein